MRGKKIKGLKNRYLLIYFSTTGKISETIIRTHAIDARKHRTLHPMQFAEAKPKIVDMRVGVNLLKRFKMDKNYEPK